MERKNEKTLYQELGYFLLDIMQKTGAIDQKNYPLLLTELRKGSMRRIIPQVGKKLVIRELTDKEMTKVYLFINNLSRTFILRKNLVYLTEFVIVKALYLPIQDVQVHDPVKEYLTKYKNTAKHKHRDQVQKVKKFYQSFTLRPLKEIMSTSDWEFKEVVNSRYNFIIEKLPITAEEFDSILIDLLKLKIFTKADKNIKTTIGLYERDVQLIGKIIAGCQLLLYVRGSILIEEKLETIKRSVENSFLIERDLSTKLQSYQLQIIKAIFKKIKTTN